ncbi:MAG: hypothetical protein H6655_08630 [Ardenticatenaceae bacterium]|nr:hypothetical protein [Ardenticatenaceae bacterium]
MPKMPPLRILSNSSCSTGAQLAVIAAARSHNLGKQVVGQQPMSLGKQGKQQPDEEVGRCSLLKRQIAQQVAVLFISLAR